MQNSSPAKNLFFFFEIFAGVTFDRIVFGLISVCAPLTFSALARAALTNFEVRSSHPRLALQFAG